MYLYRTPGVHFEWIDDQPPPILPLRTDIAGFVGIAERGPLHKPVKIESWAQFTGNFGGHIPQAYLAYAVQAFFENGGRTCWIVRVADPNQAKPATLDLGERWMSGKVITPILRLIANTPGDWGARMRCSIVRTGADRFVLTLQLPDGKREIWRDLSSDPQKERYIAKLLNDSERGSRLVCVVEPGPPTSGSASAICSHSNTGSFMADSNLVGINDSPALSLHGGVGFFMGGTNGLATLRPEHFSGESSPPDSPWGLAALAKIDEVSIVAMPDIMPKPVTRPRLPKPQPLRCNKTDEDEEAIPFPELTPEFPPDFTNGEIADLQTALIRHCENLKDRMALLETPN